jgi:hypothetical protein
VVRKGYCCSEVQYDVMRKECSEETYWCSGFGYGVVQGGYSCSGIEYDTMNREY